MNLSCLSAEQLSQALCQPGAVVAFPTDTVYGLGARIADEAGLQQIYTLKGREESKPLILLGHAGSCFLPFLGELSDTQRRVAEALQQAYWPGALTLVLPASASLSQTITRGMGTVGLRIPRHEPLLRFFKALPEGVLATTSANVSAQPPCLSAQAVREVFGDALSGILDGDTPHSEPIKGALPSAVVGIDARGKLTVFRAHPELDLSQWL